MERSVIDLIAQSEDIYFNDDNDKDCSQASEKSLELYKSFKETLSEEQKTAFENFIDQETLRVSLKLEASFKCGVKYGVRLVAECMFD